MAVSPHFQRHGRRYAKELEESMLACVHLACSKVVVCVQMATSHIITACDNDGDDVKFAGYIWTIYRKEGETGLSS